MAINYGAHAVWGSDWTNAQRAGNTALMQKYQSIMDAEPQAAQQIGMIGAKTLDMGRGSTDVWATGNNGLEYNTVGQSRTPGGGAMNYIDKPPTWQVAPGAPQGTAIGGALDPTPTMTQAQYGATAGAVPATGGPGPVTSAGGGRIIDGTTGGMTGATTGGVTSTGQQPSAFPPGTGTSGAGTTSGTITSPIATGIDTLHTGATGTGIPGASDQPRVTDTGGAPVGTDTGMINVTPGQATQTNWNVTPDQTVRSQLAKAYDPNDPLQVKAKTEALQNMNDRGLLNSSLAETAGQQAMLGVALPIAQADATTYGSAAQTNATQANQISQSNAQLRSQAAITNATLGNARWTAQLDATTKEKLANIEATYKKQMQMSSSASSLWTSTLQHMTSIMQDQNMDATSKQTALNNLVASLGTGLQVMSTLNGLNVDDLLNFG